MLFLSQILKINDLKVPGLKRIEALNLFLVIIILLYPKLISAQDSIKKQPDILYEYKFALLDRKTPLNIEYNPLVGKHIDRYVKEKRSELATYLALSKIYFPIFEYYLDKYDLPLELKYLSVVESGLDPTAKSSSGAVGLWQFLYNSAGMFDLQIDSYIDERRDVYKSTDAACRYLRYLYQTFHDWHLVLAAYNGGPGLVRTAIERSNGKTNLWDLLPYLSEQTQNYVPEFLAMDYVMNYAGDFNIAPADTSISFQNIDTLTINYPVTFSQIASNLNVSEDLIRLLNPKYKLDIIPDNGKPQTLVLPTNLILKYLKFENKILGTDTLRTDKTTRQSKVLYHVEKGDYLHKIAMKFNCSLEDIKSWNRLSTNFIAPGQTLVIWVHKDTGTN